MSNADNDAEEQIVKFLSPSLESPDMMVAPTPEVRRAQRLLHKIDDSVRNISQRQEDLQQVGFQSDFTLYLRTQKTRLKMYFTQYPRVSLLWREVGTITNTGLVNESYSLSGSTFLQYMIRYRSRPDNETLAYNVLP